MRSKRKRAELDPYESDLFVAKLRPLRDGKAVSLSVVIPRRKRPLGLFIAPGTVYGLAPNVLLLSLQDKGACLLDLCDPQVATLLRGLDLPLALAKSLLAKLNQVFKE